MRYVKYIACSLALRSGPGFKIMKDIFVDLFGNSLLVRMWMLEDEGLQN